MSGFDNEEYEYNTYFEKQKILDLAAKIRQALFKMNITNEVWHVQPNLLTYRIAPPKDDISEVVEILYRTREVQSVVQGIEPNTKIRLISVQLKPHWYVPEEEDAGKNRRHHPENP